jgi:hypothetical protein
MQIAHQRSSYGGGAGDGNGFGLIETSWFVEVNSREKETDRVRE